MSTHCPKCKMPISRWDDDSGYVDYQCGSFSHATGAAMEQSKACSELELRGTAYDALVKACEEFRETVLHGVDGLNRPRTEYLLTIFDGVIRSQYDYEKVH